jgi:predicted nuclease of predicted toxin-antitoxin system
MMFWLDAQLPPSLASWMRDTMGLDVHCVKELGLRDAADTHIFAAARAAGAILVSKDSDFVDLVQVHGSPPQLIWLTCGNVTNARLKVVISNAWTQVTAVLATGEAIVELGD